MARALEMGFIDEGKKTMNEKMRPIDERTNQQIPPEVEHHVGFCRADGCLNAWVRWGYCNKHLLALFGLENTGETK